MAGKHYREKELVELLYGVRQDEGHLEECATCGRRWSELLTVRRGVLRAPEVPEELLAAQRRSIWERVERPASPLQRLSFAPAAALVSVLLFALLLFRPDPHWEPTLAANDAQLLSEVYAVVYSTEPGAVAPIRGLFEGEQ